MGGSFHVGLGEGTADQIRDRNKGVARRSWPPFCFWEAKGELTSWARSNFGRETKRTTTTFKDPLL